MTSEDIANAMRSMFNMNKKVSEYKRPDKWLLHVPVDFAMYRKLRKYARKNHTSITKTINAAIKLYFYEMEENKNDS